MRKEVKFIVTVKADPEFDLISTTSAIYNLVDTLADIDVERVQVIE